MGLRVKVDRGETGLVGVLSCETAALIRVERRACTVSRAANSVDELPIVATPSNPWSKREG